MPDSTLNYNGDWPYLDQNNYLDATPGYTVELADKLVEELDGVNTSITGVADRVSTLEDTLVGSSDPSNIASFETGFSAVAGWEPYVARSGPTVFAGGLISIPTVNMAAGSVLMFTLPTWARPARQHRFLAFGNQSDTSGLVQVSTNGQVLLLPIFWERDPSNGYITFTGTWYGA